MKPDYLPSILGMSLPVVNVGKTQNKGYELQAKWNDKLGKDFRYWINANLSFARNKILYMNEVAQNEPWMYQTGRIIDSRSMYRDFGAFMMKLPMLAMKQNSVKIADHGITLVPGDCVYTDLNGDGKITGG